MFEFKFKEDTPKSTKFSDLKVGDIFCHGLSPVSIFMKKPHEYQGRQYQSLDFGSGHSMTTHEDSTCYILKIKAVATLA